MSQTLVIVPEKKIYVIGHKNPDTDSVVSAAAYAALKQAQGMKNCFPARAGKTTHQTEYIFHRFGVPIPELIPDLIPKVEYLHTPIVNFTGMNISLWEAMALLQNSKNRVLTLVDAAGKYHSLLHYSFLAQKLMKLISPQQKTVIPTSVDLLASVLHAQALVVKNSEEVRKSPIIVAAAEFDTFREHLGIHHPSNTIVICGNREKVQRHAIESGVRALVITNGNMISRELRELAEEKEVSVLISPYDTSSTTLLIIYSVPASSMSNAEMKPVNLKDPARKIAPLLADAPGKSLPVVNDDGVVVGVISENDLYHEPNIEIIMVDHNEPSQALEGVENYKILEIIDHHRLGNINTRYPITCINKPVGATSTIIASLYMENRVPLPNEIAAILLCGILADTLVLQSATTTRKDHETAEYLADIANLDIDALGRDLMAAASNIAGRTADELMRQDMKAYDEDKRSFSVSQVEVDGTEGVLARKAEFMAALEAEREKHGYLFSAIMVTDVTELTSLLLIAMDPRFEPYVFFPRQEPSVYVMRDVVSRKKQLMPVLSEMVAKFAAET